METQHRDWGVSPQLIPVYWGETPQPLPEQPEITELK